MVTQAEIIYRFLIGTLIGGIIGYGMSLMRHYSRMQFVITIHHKIRSENKKIRATVLALLLLLSAVINGPHANAEDNVSKLIQKLENKHPNARAQAAKELGNLKDSHAVGPLINALKDADSYVRGQASKSLGKLKDTRAVSPLINVLKDDYTYVRAEAARSLGEIKDVRAVEPLINFLKEDSTYARENAAKSLISIGPDAITPLIKAQKENNLRLIADEYSFFICRGDPGSEALLVDAFYKYGNEKMAEDFAYSGNDRLKEAAFTWAKDHRYAIRGLLGAGNSLVWGRCSS